MQLSSLPDRTTEQDVTLSQMLLRLGFVRTRRRQPLARARSRRRAGLGGRLSPYAEYQAHTQRRIPVLVATRTS